MTFDVRTTLQKPLIAVLNTGSGGCVPADGDHMAEIFSQAGLSHAQIVCVEPSQITAALKQVATSAEVVVVLGGDGTIGAAAGLCGRARKLLIPLPGGTMNMLPRALYGERPWAEALTDTLAAPVVHDVSGGRVGNRLFFCAAILGAPSLWADARESIRRVEIVEAVKRAGRAIRRSGVEPLSYTLGDGVSGTAEAVALLCPLISRRMNDDEPALEAAAIEPLAAADLFRLAFHAVFDDWRLDPAVSLAKVTRVDVLGQARVPAILDGERVRLGRTVRVDFVADAFRALAPAARAS